jgi:hypothetical protein
MSERLEISDADLRRPFTIGVIGVLILFVLIGGLIAAYGSNANRPEGVAERWLVDVGDTTRKGVREDAREAVDEIGSMELTTSLVRTQDTDGEAAFTDLEVGKAETGDDGLVRVPFRLHPRLGPDEIGDAEDGTVVLRKVDDEWRIVAVEGPTPGLAVPSEGGRPAAEAPLGLFAGAIGLSVVITAGAVIAVRAAGRPVAA